MKQKTLTMVLAGAVGLLPTIALAQAPAPSATNTKPASAAKPAAANTDPLAMAATREGAVVTDSGLVFLQMVAGKGPKPAATDTVRVHYRGTFPDGREFDSSYKRGEPARFPLNGVIKCWTEGLQRMSVGAKARLTCPSAIAYGEKGAGRGEIPPNSVLIFEVELLGIEKA